MHGDTVEHFMREWLKGKINEGTQERYAHVVEVFLKNLGKKSAMLLSKVSHRDAQDFIKSREALNLASKTIRTDVKILSSVFNLARRLGFADHNPFEKALAIKPINVVSSKRIEFTPEQVTKIFTAAKGEWKTVILFGYFTGARLSDCASMQWKNINFNRGVIDYIESKRKKRVVIPIVPEFEEYLQAIASTDSTNPFITPSLANKETRGKSGLSESFKKIMVEAGVDPLTEKGQGKRNFSKLSFHSLRHTTNTLLANNGIDQETRMALIGQTTKTVNSDYTHLNLDKLRGAMEKLPSLNLPKAAN
jgi:integrase